MDAGQVSLHVGNDYNRMYLLNYPDGTYGKDEVKRCLVRTTEMTLQVISLTVAVVENRVILGTFR
jgi:hypothetical protein